MRDVRPGRIVLPWTRLRILCRVRTGLEGAHGGGALHATVRTLQAVLARGGHGGSCRQAARREIEEEEETEGAEERSRRCQITALSLRRLPIQGRLQTRRAQARESGAQEVPLQPLPSLLQRAQAGRARGQDAHGTKDAELPRVRGGILQLARAEEAPGQGGTPARGRRDHHVQALRAHLQEQGSIRGARGQVQGQAARTGVQTQE